MNEKKINNYDLERVLVRVKKEFGEIKKGTEDYYNPQLDYLEQAIYKVYQEFLITDYDLQKIIPAIIYDLKGYIDNINYDYSHLLSENDIKSIKNLEYLFNPFINNKIKTSEDAKKDLKNLFTLPILCLSRIYDSVDFLHKRYGKNGYFRMLEEYVLPRRIIGTYPYVLDEEYLVD